MSYNVTLSIQDDPRGNTANDNMIAKSRKHLAAFMDGHMNRVRNAAPDTPGSPGDAAPIKTYLIEGCGPLPNPDDVVGPFGTLGLIAQDDDLRDQFGARLHPSGDPDLVTVKGLHGGSQPVFVYVDYSDPRFWLFYTTAPSRIADRFISLLVAAHRDLGRATLCSEFLAVVAEMGSTVALSLDHERRIGRDGPSGAGSPEFLRARVWGTHSELVTTLTRQLGSLSEGIALSQIRLRYSPERNDRGLFCLDDVRSDGRMITRGTSFSAHVSLAQSLRTCYARQVAGIESLHQIRLEDGDGVMLGRSVALHLARPVRNLRGLCERVLSSASPYRLWGLPLRRGPDCFCARAVDLNLGQRIDLEFTRDFVRLFFPKETSGGVVLRFYANVQHHLDPRVRMLDQDGNEILKS